MSVNPFAFRGGVVTGLARALSRSGRPLLTDEQGSFAGGLNTSADPSHLGPSEFVRAENCLLTDYGAIVKRRGTQRTHATAFPADIQSGASWTPLTTTSELVVAGGTLYTGTYGIPMSWTAESGSLESAGVIGFAPYEDGSAKVIYIADGGLLNKWDGSTLTTDIASTPAVTRIAVQNDRLWGITGADNILYGSAIGDGDTLGVTGSGGNAFAIATYGSQQIVELLALGSSLIMIQREAVSRFTGWTADDFSVLTNTRGISSDVGTVCASSVCSVENKGFFLSDRGFYSVTEQGVTPESFQIRPTLASLSQADWDGVRSAHFKALYELRWFIPNLGLIVYNYALKKWTGPLTGTYLDHPVVSMWSTNDTDDRPIVLTAHDDRFVRRTERPSGVCKDDVLSDGTGGVRYSLVAKCRRMFCKDAVGEKAMRFAWVTANLRTSDRAVLVCETDSDTCISHFSDIPPSGNWDVEGGAWNAQDVGIGPPWYWGGVAYDRKRLQLAGHGEWVDLTIQDDGYGESLFSRVDLRAYYLGER